FGVNGDVNIDFNLDGQVDFQIDHDRVNVSGTNLDYLQLDKNDQNAAANPLAYPTTIPNTFDQTPFDTHGTNPDNNTAVISFANPEDPIATTDTMNPTIENGTHLGGYVVALKAGDSIGSTSPDMTIWDYQE